MMMALTRCWRKLVKAASMSRSLPAFRIRRSTPSEFTAARTSAICDSDVGFVGLTSKPDNGRAREQLATVLHHRPLIKEFPLLTPGPSHSNAHLGPRKGMTDQDQDVTTALHHRPRRDWGRKSILYVAAFSSIAMLGVFVICTSFFSSPDVLAQAVNGGSPAGAPQAQRPLTPTSKLLQPNHDPKEVGSPPSPTNVTPSAGSRQPVVRAVPAQVDPLVSGVRNTPSLSVQAGRPRAVERNVGQRITIAGGVL